jgi:hypothetical protein
MTQTPKDMFDTWAMQWFGKPYKDVDKREFARRWVQDFRERHKDWTEEDWKEHENR